MAMLVWDPPRIPRVEAEGKPFPPRHHVLIHAGHEADDGAHPFAAAVVDIHADNHQMFLGGKKGRWELGVSRTPPGCPVRIPSAARDVAHTKWRHRPQLSRWFICIPRGKPVTTTVYAPELANSSHACAEWFCPPYQGDVDPPELATELAVQLQQDFLDHAPHLAQLACKALRVDDLWGGKTGKSEAGDAHSFPAPVVSC